MHLNVDGLASIQVTLVRPDDEEVVLYKQTSLFENENLRLTLDNVESKNNVLNF